MELDSIVASVERYYTGRLQQYGPTPAGVDWNGAPSQELRFLQLLRALAPLPDAAWPLLDFGCGYGALLGFLEDRGIEVRYSGFDISLAMVTEAQRLHPRGVFSSELASLPATRFVVASGVFNVKLEAETSAWETYVLDTLRLIDERAEEAWVVNFLTGFADREKMRPQLYYPDPGMLLAFARGTLKRHVAVFHDYPLFEFTLAARRTHWEPR